MGKFIVKICSEDRNGENIFLEYKIEAVNSKIAAEKAINNFYKTYWTNTEHKKEEIGEEMEIFKNNLKELREKTKLKFIPNEQIIIQEYENSLRNKLGAFDLSVREFENLLLDDKIDYLDKIGCKLSYFDYPLITGFTKINLK